MYWHFRIFFFFLLDDMTDKQEVGRTKYSKLIIRSLIKYINRIYDKLKILDRDWFSAPTCHVIGARSRECPITGVRVELSLIGYPRDSHVNYARFNSFLCNVSFSFQMLGKVLQAFSFKKVLIRHF